MADRPFAVAQVAERRCRCCGAGSPGPAMRLGGEFFCADAFECVDRVRRGDDEEAPRAYSPEAVQLIARRWREGRRL